MNPAKWSMVALGAIAVILVVVLISIIVRVNRASDETKETSQTEMTNFSDSIFVPATDDTELSTELTTVPAEPTIEETSASQTELTDPKETQPKETQPKETAHKETNPKETSPRETAPKETKPQEVKPETPTTEATQPEETEPRKPRPVEEKNPKDPKPQETVPPQTEPQPTEEPGFVPVTEPEAKPITLPYEIPTTTLKIHRIAPYDGIYLEDGANQEASEIAMILLENTGAEAVEYADITLKYGDATISFKASALPAGAKVIVQAVDKAEIPSGNLTECYATVATLPSLTMSEDQVSVADNGNNTLTVKNLTGKDIPMVRVFYKYYMEDDAVYVGGITYTAKITNLPAGESLTINPSHYTSEGGKIVMVRTYDTAE